MMMVTAFAGYDFLMKAYKEAVRFNKNITSIAAASQNLMYSHRFHGWKSIEHSINNLFKVSIYSNFGYCHL